MFRNFFRFADIIRVNPSKCVRPIYKSTNVRRGGVMWHNADCFVKGDNFVITHNIFVKMQFFIAKTLLKLCKIQTSLLYPVVGD